MNFLVINFTLWIIFIWIIVILIDPINRKVVLREDLFSSTKMEDLKDGNKNSYVDNNELKLLLVDCENGKCKSTIGYVVEIVSNKHLYKYSEIGGNGKRIDYTSNSGINDELEYVGNENDVSLISVKIENNNKLKFINENENNKRYGIKKGVISMFNDNFNIIKRGNHYIIKDLFYNAGEWYYVYWIY